MSMTRLVARSMKPVIPVSNISGAFEAPRFTGFANP
jgi:hypothetical protein